jgi:serine/threonine protein kinase
MANICLQYKRFRQYCNFPTVLIGVTANRLDISVAVCVGPIYVTKLLTLDLSLGFHASDNIIRLARVFGALSRCRANLKTYYDGVKELASPRLSCLYPSPTLIDTSKELPILTYRQFMSRAGQPTSALVNLGNVCTTIYIATLDLDDNTNREVIVKFTARYNEAAHRLLAKAGLAPKLHFCERVVGDLYMIVMDRVGGKSIWQLQEDKSPVPEIVSTKVEEALGLLHEQDIVFGDLRGNNILYVESEKHVVLVDFDWAGKDGESRYPVTLNAGKDNKRMWEEEVLPYGIMRKGHDLWQLTRLKELCSKS